MHAGRLAARRPRGTVRGSPMVGEETWQPHGCSEQAGMPCLLGSDHTPEMAKV